MNVLQSEWSNKFISLNNYVNTLSLLGIIEIRDGYKNCIGFTQEGINNFRTHVCNLVATHYKLI